MTKEDQKRIDYQISVMQAYRDGAEIEFINKTVSDYEWSNCNNPNWNWTLFDYRIKPKPKYRPYNNTTEFLITQKEHGPYLCMNNEKHTYIIPTSVVIGGGRIYPVRRKYYLWLGVTF